MMEVWNKVSPLYSRMQTAQLTHSTNSVAFGVVIDSHLVHNLPSWWERWKSCSTSSALNASTNSQSRLDLCVCETIWRRHQRRTHEKRHADMTAAISLRTFSSFNCGICWNIFRGRRIQIAWIIHRAETHCHAGGDIRKLLMQRSHCR